MFSTSLIDDLFPVSTASSTFHYIEHPSSLRDAYSYCQRNNGTLAAYNDDLNTAFQKWNYPLNITVWTGSFQFLSPWINLVGCYSYMPQPNPNRSLMFLVNTSAAACAIHCSAYSNKFFALQGKRCACIGPRDKLTRSANVGCSLQCDGSSLSEPCGSTSLNYWSLYTRVMFSQDTTDISQHCITGSCRSGNRLALYGSNCSLSARGLCSNGEELSNPSDWRSALQACISRHRAYLVSNNTQMCHSWHSNQGQRFWTGQFRGVAQHTDNIYFPGPLMPSLRIAGCSLIHINTAIDNTTSLLHHIVGCETERRPYICKLSSGTVTQQPDITTGASIPNKILTPTKYTTANSTVDNNTTLPSFSSEALKDSSISSGAVAAIVLCFVLTVSALAGALVFHRKKMLCFKDSGISQQTVFNQSYDSSYRNKPHHQGDHDHNYEDFEQTSNQTDDVQRETNTSDDVERETATDDIYAHPTFDYKVTDSNGTDTQKSYLDMGTSLPKAKRTDALEDEEYVYMGDDGSDQDEDNDNQDMYTYITPRHSLS
ncbi:uncharacterized protein [Argopecten irradians]|uniref:uncharacterized protein n=1 Tax=Argopecten irradians TaxID=31199 RepID=UPI003716713E